MINKKKLYTKLVAIYVQEISQGENEKNNENDSSVKEKKIAELVICNWLDPSEAYIRW